mmetsp:Transcript_53688/g.160735  ORF Transcript_53688/g.160735 Transcript_53688/m.160735 type:complete len:556 (-) Transcript_53688:134-1801(-)
MESSPRQRRKMAPLIALLAATAPLGVSALSERDTLLRFYARSGGSRWKNNDGWRQAAEAEAEDAAASGGDDNTHNHLKHACSWYGVVCEDGNTEGVTGLELEDNQLTGHVTSHLWNMPKLKAVNFRDNLLTGAGLEGLSSGGTPSPLETLLLSQNKIDSLDGIDAAHGTLVNLQISSNAFDGPFPKQVFELKKLQTLLATFNNNIVGELPTEIGHLTHLRKLDLSFNSFEGSIPKEIGKLDLLQVLILEENNFTGQIPSEMNKLVSLKYLSIGNQGTNSGQLTGPLPSFEDLMHLRELYLPHNALTGLIPINFLMNSAVGDKPVSINLSSNLLTGRIPETLSKFDKLNIDLTDNRITGIPSELCRKKKWMDGQVADFGCEAILCPKGTRSESGRVGGDDSSCDSCEGGAKYGPYLGSTDCLDDGEEFEDKGAVEIQDVGGESSEGTAASVQEGGGLDGFAKFIIIVIGMAALVTIGIALHKGVKQSQRQREVLGITKTIGMGISRDEEQGQDAEGDGGSSIGVWQGRFPERKALTSVSDGAGSSNSPSVPDRCIL